MVAFAILLPTVDPVSLLFETIPLLILFEASIWLSRLMERRWNRNLVFEDVAGDVDRTGTGRAVKTVSAEWVVPVEGPPIENGAVAVADDGTIAEVGASADLGTGEHYDGCVIVPGFVNAHSHLEYAIYAGFGDGLPFVPWIGMHVARKQALGPEEMVAIATVGALECLRSGITTIGDCSFSGGGGGRRRDRAPRDRLPRGLRSRRVGARPVPRAPFVDRSAPLRPDRRRCLAACAVHLHGRRLSRLRRARPASGHAFRREPRRTGVAGRG